METRANYLVVGIFALVAVTAAAFFTWWQSSGTGGATREVLFVFPGSVAGLTPGSPILFNGIKVGDVTGISLDPQNLQVVNVRARVQLTAPIKTDTRATVDQGLTGWATVGLSGGSFTADSVFEAVPEGETPRLVGQQAVLSQLLAEGETIAARVTSILDQTDTLLANTAPEITSTVANTSIITGNLAEASGDVATVLSAAGDVAQSFEGLSGEVGGLTDRVAGIIGSIDTAQINAALGNVAAITGTLAESDEEIVALLGNANAASAQLTRLLDQAGSFASEARQAVGATRGVITTVEQLATAIEPARVNAIVANVEAATGLVQENAPAISRIARNAGEASERINTILADAGDIGTVAGEAVRAIDPVALGDTVANVRALSETLASTGESISATVSSAQTATERVAAALEGSGGVGARVGAIVSEIEPAAVRATVAAAETAATRLGESLTAVDPVALGDAVANVRALTETLATSAEGVGRTVASVDRAAASAAAALEGSEGLGDRVNAIVAGVDPSAVAQTITAVRDAATSAQATIGGVDPEAVGAVVSNVRTLTGTLAGSAEGVSRTLVSVETAARRAAGALEGAETAGADVAALIAGIDPAALSETVASVRGAAAAAERAAGAIDPEALGDAVFNVRTLTETLAGSAEGVSRTIASVETVANRAASALAGTETIGADAAALVAGVDPAALGETVASVRGAAAAAERAVNAIDPEALGDAVFNVQSLTETLAGSAEGVGRTIASVETAANRAASALAGTETIGADAAALVAGVDPVALGETVASVRGAAAAAERAAGAIDPEALGDAVFNVQSLTETLAGSAEGVSRTIASVETAANRAASALAGTETIGADAAALVAGVDPAALGETVASVRGAAAAAERAVNAIDPEALGDAVFNVQSLTETLAGSAEGVGRVVSSAETAAARAVAALEGTENLGTRLGAIAEDAGSLVGQANAIAAGIAPETVTALVDNVATASGSATTLLESARNLPSSIDATLLTTRGAVRQARGVLEALDAEAVRQSVANVETLTDTLAAQAPEIEATVANVRSASARANAVMGDASEFSASFSQVSEATTDLVDRLDGLVAGIEPDALSETVNNVRDVTVTLAENREAIGQALEDVSGLASRLRESADRVDGLLASANGLVDEEARNLLANASSAAQSLRDLSTELNQRIPQIAGNLNNFTGRGLEGLSALIEQGQRTVGSLDRVIGSVESNPEQFLFGRSEGSEYTPRGRQ